MKTLLNSTGAGSSTALPRLPKSGRFAGQKVFREKTFCPYFFHQHPGIRFFLKISGKTCRLALFWKRAVYGAQTPMCQKQEANRQACGGFKRAQASPIGR
jgi:hypothetical protein